MEKTSRSELVTVTVLQSGGQFRCRPTGQQRSCCDDHLSPANTPRSSSVTAAAMQVCAPRWVRSATPMTTPCARASSPLSNASFSIADGSRHVCCQLDQRSFGGTITNERDAPRVVYRWVRRIDMPERNAMVPKPCAPAYSERSWHEAVPTRRPRSVTCFLTYVVVDTRVYTAIWRAFSLSGAAAAYRRMVYLLLTRMRRLHSWCMW